MVAMTMDERVLAVHPVVYSLDSTGQNVFDKYASSLLMLLVNGEEQEFNIVFVELVDELLTVNSETVFTVEKEQRRSMNRATLWNVRP